MLKILFVDFTLPFLLKDSNYPVGGWAVELYSWLTGLSYNGHRAAVLTWKGGAEYAGNSFQKFELLDTYDPQKGVKVVKYFYYYIPTLLKTAKDFGPDVIIQACSGVNTGIMAFIADRLSVPFLYRVANDMDVDARYKNRLQIYEQIAYRYGLRRAKAILCQNQYQFDCLQKWFPEKPLHVLHNPFDTQRILPDVKNRREKKYIAWLGIFSSQKNLPLLVKVAQKQPEIEFRIAGKPSISMDRETKNAVDQLSNLKNVKMVGYVHRKDVLDFLSQAVALLSTSHYEGFSNTFLEALASGTPVIAPHRVDPDLIITNNMLGLTSQNDDELPNLVKQIWEMDLEDYNPVQQRCRAYLFNNHDPEIKARELVDMLKPLVMGVV